MNKYLLQALTAKQKQFGLSGYEVAIYAEDKDEATVQATAYVGDENYNVELISWLEYSTEESSDQHDESGAVEWFVTLSHKSCDALEVGNGIEYSEELAQQAAKLFIFNYPI